VILVFLGQRRSAKGSHNIYVCHSVKGWPDKPKVNGDLLAFKMGPNSPLKRLSIGTVYEVENDDKGFRFAAGKELGEWPDETETSQWFVESAGARKGLAVERTIKRKADETKRLDKLLHPVRTALYGLSDIERAALLVHVMRYLS
jgi:hypothetical protein